MKKTLVGILFASFVTLTYFAYSNGSKVFPLYSQISQNRVGTEIDLQTEAQKDAHFVGSSKCKECHEENHNAWIHSKHAKMLQDPQKNPKAVVADFSKLPPDADFTLKDAVYTVGGKFKQRFMLRKDINSSEDYVLGNYQWNVQTQQWQSFKAWNYWYKDAFVRDNKEVPTSRTCDGCHFVGFMSQEKRIEPGIACESCHGPASKHVENPTSQLYLASLHDPIRQNEVCLQCHMRNRDKRLDTQTIAEIFGDARDYPQGYEAGKPLSHYKTPAPFIPGHETKEFYANGMGKKNRSQGNEFVHSMKAQHGITCINCHNPHLLNETAEKNTGNKLCMECHKFNSPIGPHQENLQAHTRHKENSKGSLCVECHMPKVAKHTSKSPLTVRTHQFGFVTPKETLMYNMPQETNACFACHKDPKHYRNMETLQKDLESWGMVNWSKR